MLCDFLYKQVEYYSNLIMVVKQNGYQVLSYHQQLGKRTPQSILELWGALLTKPCINTYQSLTITRYFEALQNISGFVINMFLTRSLSLSSLTNV